MFLVGCDFGKPPKKATQVTTVADDSDLPAVAHPEYVNWSQFPEKAFVIRKRVVSNAQGKVVVTTKMWLDKKTSEKILVGSQVTVERPDEPAVENGDDVVSYPATYRLPKGMDQSRFNLPSAKAKETGEEVVKIGELELKTKIFEWEESNETGPMTVKLWTCAEVPGKIVRQEMFTKSTQTKSSEEVIKLDLGNVAG